MIRFLTTGLFALIGLAFGRSLNIYLLRWSTSKTVLDVTSNCPQCGYTLKWPTRIPALGWLLLGGHCPACKVKFGWRCPLVELGLASTWAIAAWSAFPEMIRLDRTPFSMYDAVLFAVVKMTLCWFLIALIVLDTEHHSLPDRLTLGGAALGLLISAARFSVKFWFWTALPLHWSMQTGMEGHRAEVYDATLRWLVAIIAGPLLILLIRRVYHWLRGHDGVEMGEAKLMLMMAAWLGLSHTVLAFCLGMGIGAAIAVVVLLVPSFRRGTDLWHFTKLRMGTLLALGSILSALWGRQIIDAYIDLCHFY